ncbi:MAG: UDP-N-acetylmuramoyl-tripeptide--D-alanyl-D-alanine ligase [Firmicutes bacterium]|nr:UDP-N-acetylmuramoyl-tripeptide--D-alanyl-D-alanine ligase [Bacillota bacterium]
MKMKSLSLETIAKVTGGTYIGVESAKDVTIQSVEHDSRKVTEGALFLCIKGERSDGHDYANKAYDLGAVCCLCEQELPDAKGPYVLVESTLIALKALGAYYRGLFTIPVVGITGSVGKTSAKEMIASALSAKFNICKTEANLNNEIGVPLTLLNMREEHEAAVIEMGISDFGEMTRLGQMVRPDICVMTNIGYCHLECLGDLNGVLKAKSEVFAQMAENGIAVVNGDDELLSAFDPGLKKITYGISENNDFRAEDIKDSGTEGIDCVMSDGERRFAAHIPAFGSHMVLAALAAATVSKELGLTDEEITRGLLGYKAVGGRANVTDTGKYTVINDCYNANPNSVRAALTSLAGLNGRKVAILGDMFELGAESDALHESIGVFAAEKEIDLLICCGENSKHIYQGFIKSTDREAYHFTNRDTMISALPTFLEKGDNILVKASHGMHFDAVVETLLKTE